MSRGYVLLVLVVAVLSSGITWLLTRPAPPPAPVDGIVCEAMEGKAMHIHAQLQLWRDGKPLAVPEGIGRARDCYYWLHTHTPDGIIHVESPVLRDFTLGQVFDVWGKNPFDEKTSMADQLGLQVWVKKEGDRDFHQETGRWQDLVLSPHEILAMGTGAFSGRDFTFPEGF